jgi:hypothetical protein
METWKKNYIVDVLLALSFLAVTLTGILKFPGLIPALGLSYRDLPMVFLSNLHDWSGIAMAVLVLIHLILHWNWIVTFTKKIFISEGKKE